MDQQDSALCDVINSGKGGIPKKPARLSRKRRLRPREARRKIQLLAPIRVSKRWSEASLIVSSPALLQIEILLAQSQMLLLRRD